MKLNSFLLLCLCLIFSIHTANAQKGKTVQLKSLKASKSLATAISNNKVKSFTINQQGIIRPAKGFIIIYDKAGKKIHIGKKGFGLPDFRAMDDSQDLGNGYVMLCRGCNKCTIVEHDLGGGRKSWACTGMCGDVACTEHVVFEPNGITYESDGGYSDNWRGL